MWSDFLILSTEDALVGAFVATVAVFIFWIIVNNRPDPKMALLLKLMADFPKEPEGKEGDSCPGSEEGESPPYPRGHEFLS